MAEKEKELLKKKEEAKNYWEKCFEDKIEDVFKAHTLEKFWSSNTSYEEALEILDEAALFLLSKSLKDLALSVFTIDLKKESKKEDKLNCDFNVFDSEKQEIVYVGLSTYDEAHEKAKQYCLDNGVKLSSVKVFKMYD